MKERIFSATVGALLLIIFHPFALTATGWPRWVLLLGVLLLAILACVVAEALLRYVLRMPNDVSKGFKYIRRRNVCFQLLFIPLCSLGFVAYGKVDVMGEHLVLGNFVEVVIYLIFICFLMMLYWSNRYRNRFLQRQLEDTIYLNGILEERKKTAERLRQEAEERAVASLMAEARPREEVAAPTVPEQITLQGTTRESLTLRIEDFLYAESDSNYVNINYLHNGELRSTQLRLTIRQVEETFAPCPNVKRCHRAFVANLSLVEEVEQQGHVVQLKLRNLRTMVPVSRTYMDEVREQIINLQQT